MNIHPKTTCSKQTFICNLLWNSGFKAAADVRSQKQFGDRFFQCNEKYSLTNLSVVVIDLMEY